jgi:hypothetical protein
MNKMIFAISTAAPAIPQSPKRVAISAMINNVTTQLTMGQTSARCEFSMRIACK